MRSSTDGTASRLTIIGDQASRRMPFLLEAARRCGLDPIVISYEELQDGRFKQIAPGQLVRIESPGESSCTARRILKSGIEPMEALRRIPLRDVEIDEQPLGRGEIVHPLQWFLGFREILRRFNATCSSRGVRWMNSPEAILTAFDKRACLDRWSAAGLPIPPGHGDFATYSQIRAAVPDRHARLFIKLRYGYSAMGAVALEWRGDLVRAITTVDVSWHAGRPRLFVSKRTRVLQREFEIAWLIDTLAMEGIIVEDWLPKARWRGKPFDVRIVTIGGVARHVIGRASSSPFTNLNLGAVRMDRTEVAAQLGDAWATALNLAEQAASHISHGYLGMDILVRPCGKRFAVLEANAFGDYLPGLLHEGESTYLAELRPFTPCEHHS